MAGRAREGADRIPHGHCSRGTRGGPPRRRSVSAVVVDASAAVELVARTALGHQVATIVRQHTVLSSTHIASPQACRRLEPHRAGMATAVEHHVLRRGLRGAGRGTRLPAAHRRPSPGVRTESAGSHTPALAGPLWIRQRRCGPSGTAFEPSPANPAGGRAATGNRQTSGTARDITEETTESAPAGRPCGRRSRAPASSRCNHR